MQSSGCGGTAPQIALPVQLSRPVCPDSGAFCNIEGVTSIRHLVLHPVPHSISQAMHAKFLSGIPVLFFQLHGMGELAWVQIENGDSHSDPVQRFEDSSLGVSVPFPRGLEIFAGISPDFRLPTIFSSLALKIEKLLILQSRPTNESQLTRRA